MFDFINKRIYWFALSTILVVGSLIVIFTFGLNWGIDFTGGSLLELKINDTEKVTQQTIEDALVESGIDSYTVQPSDENVLLIRMPDITEEKHQEILNNIGESGEVLEQEGMQIKLAGPWSELRFESIGPVIGKELQNKAYSAIILVLIAIVAYIAFAFRKVSYPVASWKYGLSAIVALAHDVLIIVGVFSLLGQFMNYQIDILFVTALLTVMGFSVHDTIVTFDRTRENLYKHQDKTFGEIVNQSINETIVRSLNTSITTLIVLSAIFFFGGATISEFILALMAGIIIGTYSSIFLASPLLMVWYKVKR